MISKKQIILLLSGLVFGLSVGRILFNHYQDNQAELLSQANEDPLEGIISEFMHSSDETGREKTLGDEARENPHQAHESSHQDLLNRMKRKKTDSSSLLPDDPEDVGPLEYEDFLSRYKNGEEGSIEEFKESLVQVYEQIPTLKQIQELPPAELHHMPRPLQVMGIYMGDLKEILKARHEFFSEGMRYYRLCALNPQFMDAIRSLCLANLIEFGDEREDGLEGRYPRAVIDLALQVRDWP